ncbi:putative LPS assembly protein LptD [Mucilaginibacter arboris]|uniref:LPS-assembly protein LptD n=1 Tax=Mucilaginibacter arboris TaxID=2682090 RepID=A0A7K1SXD4_9SPHI|nr:putative LPS assembly protein LptD [Mucilaginibacter arboris]MVN21986.1 LPS-assembly protein LptD [Mucilaginibacter arboris]
MRFIKLLFPLLLVTICFFSAFSFSVTRIAKKYKLLINDTIIHLDSSRRQDRVLLQHDTTVRAIGKVKGKTTAKKTGVKTASKADTTSKSKNGLGSTVKYAAEDSIITDHKNNIVYLYGRARITYEDAALDADYIKLDQKNHLAYAKGIVNPKTKRYAGRPILKQKNESPVTADSLVFDYTTKKAKIYQAYSEQEGNYISGGQAKKLNETEIAYRNILFSTCDLPYPDTHFGIVITKGIAEKNQIISGPAYLEIEGVPLPIAIPFGFFPKPDKRTSGIILPTFGEDATLGFNLRNFGYYMGFGDKFDLTNYGSIYSKGSFELSSDARYFDRYKYSGNLVLSYGYHKYGLATDPAAKDFNIRWSHTQNPNANPGTTFSASVNAGTSTYYTNNASTVNYNLTALTQNNLRSSIAYSKTWAGTPFNFTASANHSQELSSKTITLDLPSFTFNMASINPFDSKNRVGEQKWYQRINVQYTLTGDNRVTAIPESQFLTKTIFKRFQNGFQQNIPVSLSLNVLKYFQFSSSVNYSEVDYLQTIRQRYTRGNTSGVDSLVTDTVPGFRRAGTYNLSTGLSTKLYGTVNFKGGRLKAIRHTMTPSLSFQYRPDYNNNSYGYYQNVVSNPAIPYPYSLTRYSIFANSLYQGPSGGRSAGLALSVDNTIEAKVRAKSTDTTNTDRKVPILQGLSFSTFYNFVADSMKLSPISVSGRTALFNQKLGINFSGIFDPYTTIIKDSISNGQIVKYARRINQYTLESGKLPRLTAFSLSTNFSLNSNTIKNQSQQHAQNTANTLQGMNQQQAGQLAMINRDPNAFVDFNIPWNVSFNYNFTYTNSGISTTVNNAVNINGDFNVTPKWKLQYTSGYDFRLNKISTTSLSIYRDLHCWDLAFQWIPFGYYKYYSVDLRVKASILQTLKLNKRKDYYNNY